MSDRRPIALPLRCFNPAALSVNTETRSIAVKVYNVVLPLALEKPHVVDEDKPGCFSLSDHRLLYLALDRDTLVLLAEEPAARVVRLVNWLRQQDGGGLYRFCVSAGHFAHPLGAHNREFIGGEVFHDVENFGLMIGSSARRRAPSDWSREGTYALPEFPSEEGYDEDDGYEAFGAGMARKFREKDGWMVAGKREMQIASLRLQHGG